MVYLVDLIRLDYKLLESDRKKVTGIQLMKILKWCKSRSAEKKKFKLSAIKKNCVDKERVFENNFNKISKYLHHGLFMQMKSLCW